MHHIPTTTCTMEQQRSLLSIMGPMSFENHIIIFNLQSKMLTQFSLSKVILRGLENVTERLCVCPLLTEPGNITEW